MSSQSFTEKLMVTLAVSIGEMVDRRKRLWAVQSQKLWKNCYNEAAEVAAIDRDILEAEQLRAHLASSMVAGSILSMRRHLMNSLVETQSVYLSRSKHSRMAASIPLADRTWAKDALAEQRADQAEANEWMSAALLYQEGIDLFVSAWGPDQTKGLPEEQTTS